MGENIEVNGCHYEIRCLRSDELENWTIFCATCFSEKANPPNAQYFMNHFLNDPYSDISLIFVIVKVNISSDSNNILSTLRLFKRNIFIKSKKVSTAGIGEVCTLKSYRRNGFSKILLKYACDRSKELKFNIMMLHAAEWVRPLYHQFHFQSVSTIVLNIKKVSSYPSKQLSSYELPENQAELCNNFNKSFSGCVHRTDEYFNNWTKYEAKKGMIYTLDEYNNKQGYVILLACNEHRFQVWDFVLADANMTSQRFLDILQKLMNTIDDNGVLSIPKSIILRFCPDSLHQDKINSSEFTFEYLEYIDNGWMFRDLSENQDYSEMTLDCFWGIDNF